MYNRAILVGRLGADPELRQTPNGVSVTNFSIAVNRPYTGKDGSRETDWLDIVAWRQTAEFICRYFTKGQPILVEGSIQTRQYTDKNGTERRVWEVVADNARFVQGKSEDSQTSSQAAQSKPQPNNTPAEPEQTGLDDFAEVDDDGDLPF